MLKATLGCFFAMIITEYCSSGLPHGVEFLILWSFLHLCLLGLQLHQSLVLSQKLPWTMACVFLGAMARQDSAIRSLSRDPFGRK